MSKKVYRSEKNKKIAGVCGGLADYFGIDPTIIRVIWAIFIFVYGGGLLAYILCWLLIPKESELYY